MSTTPRPRATLYPMSLPWLVRGDIDGFFGLALDNLSSAAPDRLTPGDTAISLRPAWEWALGYAAMSAWFVAARWVTEPGDEHAS